MAAVTVADTEDYFDFFGLARELRDMIYDEVLAGSKKTLTTYPDQIRTSVRHVAPVNMLLTGKQFSTEIEERSRPMRRLVIEDISNDLDDEIGKCNLPAKTLNFSKVHLNLYATCGGVCGSDRCTLDSELKCHLAWVPDFLESMSDLQSVTIHLFVPSEAEYHKQVIRENFLGKAIPQLVSFKVGLVDFNKKERGVWMYPEAAQPFMQWNKEEGKWEDVEEDDEAEDGVVDDEGKAVDEGDGGKGTREARDMDEGGGTEMDP